MSTSILENLETAHPKAATIESASDCEATFMGLFGAGRRELFRIYVMVVDRQVQSHHMVSGHQGGSFGVPPSLAAMFHEHGLEQALYRKRVQPVAASRLASDGLAHLAKVTAIPYEVLNDAIDFRGQARTTGDDSVAQEFIVRLRELDMTHERITRRLDALGEGVTRQARA